MDFLSYHRDHSCNRCNTAVNLFLICLCQQLFGINAFFLKKWFAKIFQVVVTMAMVKHVSEASS